MLPKFHSTGKHGYKLSKSSIEKPHFKIAAMVVRRHAQLTAGLTFFLAAFYRTYLQLVNLYNAISDSGVREK